MIEPQLFTDLDFAEAELAIYVNGVELRPLPGWLPFRGRFEWLWWRILVWWLRPRWR